MTMQATQKLFNVLVADLGTNSRDKAKFRWEMKKLIHDVTVKNANEGKEAAANEIARYWGEYVTAYVIGFDDEAAMKANKKHDIDNPALTVKEYLKAETGYTFESNRPKFGEVKAGKAVYTMTVTTPKAKEESEGSRGNAAKESGSDEIAVTKFATVEEALNAMICQFGLDAIAQQVLCRYNIPAADASVLVKKLSGKSDKVDVKIQRPAADATEGRGKAGQRRAA